MYSKDDLFDKSEEREVITKGNRRFLAQLFLISQLGIRIAVCIIIGVFTGNYLDAVFNSQPWLLLIFSFLAVLAAFQLIFSFAKELG